MATLGNALGIAGAAANPTFTYSPTDISIILHTADEERPYEHAVNGFAAGTFVQIDRDNPAIESGPVTMDGRTQRKIGYADGMYTIAITLVQSSLSNAQLEQMYLRDVTLTYLESDWARQWLTIKDEKSGMLFGPWTAWIESIPSVSYSNGMETRQWTLKAFGRTEDIAIHGNETEFEFTGGLGIAANLANGAFGKLRS